MNPSPSLDPDSLPALFPRGYQRATMAHLCVVGPCDLVSVETRRARAAAGLASEVACEILLWGEGPPSSPEHSSIGGWPFLGVRHEWPTGEDGKPLEFLCRLSLVPDSHGWSGACVFARTLGGKRVLPSSIVVLADRVGDACRVHQLTGVQPRPEFHGVRVAARDFAAAVGEEAEWVAVLAAAKVGGLPTRRQDLLVPSGFVAQLSSFLISHSLDWPLVNRQRHDGRGEFAFGDMGCLGLYHRNGELEPELET